MSGVISAGFWWQYTNPNTLPNLEVFYDGSASTVSTFNSGVIASGTEITSWHNNGGLSSHDWNSTGGARPEWYSNIKNGLGVVRFNGTTVGTPSGEDGDNNENLTINPVTYLQNLSGSCLILLFRSLTAGAGTRYLTSTDVGGFQFGMNGTQWIGGFSGATFTIDGVTADTDWHHIVINFDGTQTGNSNRLKARLDSVDVTLTFTGTVNNATSGASKYFYGGATGTSASNQSNFWVGDLGELMIFTRALKLSEITSIENYLTTKWAV